MKELIPNEILFSSLDLQVASLNLSRLMGCEKSKRSNSSSLKVLRISFERREASLDGESMKNFTVRSDKRAFASDA